MRDRVLGERFSITNSFFESNSIYEAKDVDGGEKVLVKIIPLLPKEMKRWTKYENELRVISQLNNPGIIKIREWGDCDGGKYIAFEHIDGVRLSEAKLSVTSCIRVLLRIAEALKSMHGVELIHRDLKPENIVLYDQTNLLIKFFDFGTSASEETRLRQIKPNEIIRTLAWISPEALRNEPVSLKSNLYQLGLIGYMLLAGQLPYKEDTPSSLIWQILHLNPLPVSSINPRVPVALENILKRLLRKDPESRFESIDDVIEILRELAKQENISSTFSIRTGLLLGRGRIVGRSKEINRLALSLKEQHKTEIFQINGDMGIGKTRLIQEIASQARISDIPTIIVGCDPFHTTRNLSTINQIVSDGIGMLGTGTVGKSVFKNILVKLCPELAERIITADPSEMDAYELERQAIPALKWLLEAISQKGRLMLIIDDAEHIDSGSHRMMQKLLTCILDLPMTLILTSRKRLEIPYCISIDLEPLSKKDISIMLHENIGSPNPNEELPDVASTISKGNPLMLELLISGLAANKGLDSSGSITIKTDAIPRSLEDLLEWQLPKLSQSVLDMLSVASIIGTSFEEPTLIKISGKSRLEVADALDMGMLANLIIHYKSPSGYRYRFITGQLSEMLTQRFTKKHRLMVHDLVIKQILSKPERQQDDEIWTLIGHLKETGNTKLLIEKMVRASDLLAYSHDIQKSVDICKEAYQLSIQSADTQLETKAVINLADKLGILGEYAKAIDLLTGILKTAKQIGIDQLSESDLLHNLAAMHTLQGSFTKSQELSQESFKIISRLGDDERLVKLHFLESQNFLDFDCDMSLRQAQKAASLVEKFPESEYARGAYNSLASNHLMNGNIEQAKQALAKAKDFTKQNSLFIHFFNTYVIEAEIAVLEGEMGQAEEIVSNIEREGIAEASVPIKVGTELIKASLHVSRGQYQDAIAIYQNLVSTNLQIGSKTSAASILLKMSRTFIDAGEMDGAKYSLYQAQNLIADIDNTAIKNSIILMQATIKLYDNEYDKSLEHLLEIQYKALSPFEKTLYKYLMSLIHSQKGEFRKALGYLNDEVQVSKQFLALPTISYSLNMIRSEIYMAIITKSSEHAIPQKTLMLSKNGLLGQDLPALAKQALDLAYVNTLYSGIRTQQPKASFALAKFHCLQAVTDKQNSQYHKDECLRLIEMTIVLANDLCMPTLVMKAQNLETALRQGQAPTGL